jgi:hypothetical protein
MRRGVAAGLVAGLTCGHAAWAHRPTFGDAAFDGPFDAFFVADTDVSIVLYERLTCEADTVWLRFDAVAGQDLYLQLGVPEIERLRGDRPAIALLAPGLPAVELPFDVPEGLGGLVWYADERSEPDTFYEPFTQTSSWVWVEQTVTLPEAGAGYVVAFNPAEQTTKLWVAVGTVEDFSEVEVSDFASWNVDVNDFHETGKFSEPPTAPETSCAAEEPVDEAGCGCASSPAGGAGSLAGVGLLVAAVRGRRTTRGSGRSTRRSGATAP